MHTPCCRANLCKACKGRHYNSVQHAQYTEGWWTLRCAAFHPQPLLAAYSCGLAIALSTLSSLLPQAPPSYVLVENVVGFEQSRTRTHMLESMQAAGYAIQVSLLNLKPKRLSHPCHVQLKQHVIHLAQSSYAC